MSGTRSRNVGALIGSNLLGGVGVASGVAVGALLVEELGGTSFAGLGQSASILVGRHRGGPARPQPPGAAGGSPCPPATPSPSWGRC